MEDEAPAGHVSLWIGVIALVVVIAVLVYFLLTLATVDKFGLPYRVLTVPGNAGGNTGAGTFVLTAEPNVIYQVEPRFRETTITIAKPTDITKLTGTTFFIDNTNNGQDLTLLAGNQVVLPANAVVLAGTAGEFYWTNDTGTLRRLFFSSLAVNPNTS